MTKLRTTSLVLTLALASACGTTPQDRGLSGAGIGAGAGAVIGAVTGLTVLEAAALGAVGGALTGMLTKPEQVDLGQPTWQQGQASAPAPAAATPANPAQQAALAGVVQRVQGALAARGYDPGPQDGVVGARTRAAIRAYQRDQGLVADGQLSPELLARLGA